MAVVDIKNLEGKNVGQIELPDAVYKAKVNPNLLHETVRWYQASQRAGTHKTKGRGEVSGSGKKLWKQKGTGRARVGSIRSSLWRKGGTVHGPVPRSYAYKLPRKMVLGALRSALSAKLADEKLTVVDAWQLDSHKTKPFREALGKLDGATKTMLLVEISANRNLELASRNLEGVKLVAPHALQPYDLLRPPVFIEGRGRAARRDARTWAAARRDFRGRRKHRAGGSKTRRARQGRETRLQGKEGAGKESDGKKAGGQGKIEGQEVSLAGKRRRAGAGG